MGRVKFVAEFVITKKPPKINGFLTFTMINNHLFDNKFVYQILTIIPTWERQANAQIPHNPPLNLTIFLTISVLFCPM